MEAIIQFLKEKVIGKAIYTEEVRKQSEDGSDEIVSEDIITFSNLISWDNNLHFDFFVVSSEITYKTDDRKQRIGFEKEFNGAALFRYELVKRKSTGKLTGVMRFISSTGENNVEAVVSGLYDVRFQDGRLSWREEQMLYRDHPDADGLLYPASFDAQNCLFAENGKLRFEHLGINFSIDENTFEKHLDKAVFPDFIGSEK